MGAQMAKAHERFPFELVITVGDNLYGSQRPQDFQTKFEEPYKALLAAGVKFYASLGNHDEREVQRNYKLFNMDGKLYYTFKAPKQNVRFFALDSTYPDPAERAWLEKELDGSDEGWKIPYFHHPLYSSGERHGSTPTLQHGLGAAVREVRRVSVVFAGHDHFYERTKPQKDIVHFVTGSGGQLRKGNIDRAYRPDRERVRHRSGISDGGDRPRRALLQRDLPHRRGGRFRRHPATETGVASFSFSSLFLSGLRGRSRLGPVRLEDSLNLLRNPRVGDDQPTSRRPSSSSFRRL